MTMDPGWERAIALAICMFILPPIAVAGVDAGTRSAHRELIEAIYTNSPEAVREALPRYAAWLAWCPWRRPIAHDQARDSSHRIVLAWPLQDPVLTAMGCRTDTGTWSYAAEASAVKRNDAILDLLLRHGCDPNVRNADGETALYIAALRGRMATVHSLIRYGADPIARDSTGRTAGQMAGSVRGWEWPNPGHTPRIAIARFLELAENPVRARRGIIQLHLSARAPGDIDRYVFSLPRANRINRK